MLTRAYNSAEYQSNSSSMEADDVLLKSLYSTVLARSALNSSMENCFHCRPSMGVSVISGRLTGTQHVTRQWSDKPTFETVTLVTLYSERVKMRLMPPPTLWVASFTCCVMSNDVIRSISSVACTTSALSIWMLKSPNRITGHQYITSASKKVVNFVNNSRVTTSDSDRYMDASTKSPSRLALRRLHTNSNFSTRDNDDIFEDLYVERCIIATPPWLTRRSEGG